MSPLPMALSDCWMEAHLSQNEEDELESGEPPSAKRPAMSFFESLTEIVDSRQTAGKFIFYKKVALIIRI